MSHEITNTLNKFANQELPEGRHKFIVAGPVVKKYGGKGGEFFIWKLQYDGGIGEQVLLPNMMGELLRVLECQETEPNIFDWDTADQEGKVFMATIKLAPDKKDPKVIRQHMSEYAKVETSDIPF